MVTRAHCIQFVGQHVVFQTNDGALHQGILHSIADGGIYVSPVGGTASFANMSGKKENAVALLQNVPHSRDSVDEAFWPFLFFPFLALAFLLPWAMWW